MSNYKSGVWTDEEDNLLAEWQAVLGNRWSEVARKIPGKTGQQCAQRWRHRVNPSIRREKWTLEEDQLLSSLFSEHGTSWAVIARCMPGRTDQQCMGRWRRHLDPSIRRESWTPEEDVQLYSLVDYYGCAWSIMSKNLKGRTPQQCRTRWHYLTSNPAAAEASRARAAVAMAAAHAAAAAAANGGSGSGGNLPAKKKRGRPSNASKLAAALAQENRAQEESHHRPTPSLHVGDGIGKVLHVSTAVNVSRRGRPRTVARGGHPSIPTTTTHKPAVTTTTYDDDDYEDEDEDDDLAWHGSNRRRSGTTTRQVLGATAKSTHTHNRHHPNSAGHQRQGHPGSNLIRRRLSVISQSRRMSLSDSEDDEDDDDEESENEDKEMENDARGNTRIVVDAEYMPHGARKSLHAPLLYTTTIATDASPITRQRHHHHQQQQHSMTTPRRSSKRKFTALDDTHHQSYHTNAALDTNTYRRDTITHVSPTKASRRSADHDTTTETTINDNTNNNNIHNNNNNNNNNNNRTPAMTPQRFFSMGAMNNDNDDDMPVMLRPPALFGGHSAGHSPFAPAALGVVDRLNSHQQQQRSGDIAMAGAPPLSMTTHTTPMNTKAANNNNNNDTTNNNNNNNAMNALIFASSPPMSPELFLNPLVATPPWSKRKRPRASRLAVFGPSVPGGLNEAGEDIDGSALGAVNTTNTASMATPLMSVGGTDDANHGHHHHHMRSPPSHYHHHHRISTQGSFPSPELVNLLHSPQQAQRTILKDADAGAAYAPSGTRAAAGGSGGGGDDTVTNTTTTTTTPRKAGRRRHGDDDDDPLASSSSPEFKGFVTPEWARAAAAVSAAAEEYDAQRRFSIASVARRLDVDNVAVHHHHQINNGNHHHHHNTAAATSNLTTSSQQHYHHQIAQPLQHRHSLRDSIGGATPPASAAAPGGVIVAPAPAMTPSTAAFDAASMSISISAGGIPAIPSSAMHIPLTSLAGASAAATMPVAQATPVALGTSMLLHPETVSMPGAIFATALQNTVKMNSTSENTENQQNALNMVLGSDIVRQQSLSFLLQHQPQEASLNIEDARRGGGHVVDVASKEVVSLKQPQQPFASSNEVVPLKSENIRMSLRALLEGV